MGIPRKMIFVFGSNEAGIHGAGAAKVAHDEYGAVMGHSYGLCGQSWAIPTKDINIETIEDLGRINAYVLGFLAYAAGHPKQQFKITRIGCGLAGLHDWDIAPMFSRAPSNCWFDEAWKPWLGEANNYWGTF